LGRRRLRWLLVPLILIVAVAAATPLWLPWIGTYLVQAGEPEKADMIVVLAGDGWGRRVLKGAELAKQGYAPQVLVSGPDGSYDNWESDLAIAFAEKHSYPRTMFIGFPHRGRSTLDEARLMAPYMRERGVKKFLLVTTDTHTRRAGRTFRRYAKDMQVIVVAAPSKGFTPEGWWKDREGRKAIVFEWLKTVAEWVGL
jgi:uncharacterized SAM-binding protein YcdF (DUF218 family)